MHEVQLSAVVQLSTSDLLLTSLGRRLDSQPYHLNSPKHVQTKQSCTSLDLFFSLYSHGLLLSRSRRLPPSYARPEIQILTYDFRVCDAGTARPYICMLENQAQEISNVMSLIRSVIRCLSMKQSCQSRRESVQWQGAEIACAYICTLERLGMIQSRPWVVCKITKASLGSG